MESTDAGDLVKVATGARQIDGIIVDVLSAAKLVVAVMDRDRGPVLRTVSAKALAERSEAGPDDRALQLLVRRTRPPVRGAARAGAGLGASRAGHMRAAMHRTTGK
jgi:hypothetical protein